MCIFRTHTRCPSLVLMLVAVFGMLSFSLAQAESTTTLTCRNKP